MSRKKQPINPDMIPFAGEYLPTREEIDAVCAEIRKGWTDHEHRRRGSEGRCSRNPVRVMQAIRGTMQEPWGDE